MVRHGSLIAFRVGSRPLAEAGMRLVGAHTDSPTFKVRPHSDVRQAGYRLVGVEPYGGGLWHTWLDRELTVAGRVALRGGSTALVGLPGAPLRLPSLAIHLDRSVREGLTLDPAPRRAKRVAARASIGRTAAASRPSTQAVPW